MAEIDPIPPIYTADVIHIHEIVEGYSVLLLTTSDVLGNSMFEERIYVGNVKFTKAQQVRGENLPGEYSDDSTEPSLRLQGLAGFLEEIGQDLYVDGGVGTAEEWMSLSISQKLNFIMSYE